MLYCFGISCDESDVLWGNSSKSYLCNDGQMPHNFFVMRGFIFYLANISLVWSVIIELSALTMTARADVTPAFSNLFTRFSIKSFLSWEKRVCLIMHISNISCFICTSVSTLWSAYSKADWYSFFLLLIYLGVLLRHMLLRELGKLNQLRDDFLLIITVGAVNQSASDCV